MQGRGRGRVSCGTVVLLSQDAISLKRRCGGRVWRARAAWRFLPNGLRSLVAQIACLASSVEIPGHSEPFAPLTALAQALA